MKKPMQTKRSWSGWLVSQRAVAAFINAPAAVEMPSALPGKLVCDIPSDLREEQGLMPIVSVAEVIRCLGTAGASP